MNIKWCKNGYSTYSNHIDCRSRQQVLLFCNCYVDFCYIIMWTSNSLCSCLYLKSQQNHHLHCKIVILDIISRKHIIQWHIIYTQYPAIKHFKTMQTIICCVLDNILAFYTSLIIRSPISFALSLLTSDSFFLYTFRQA